jgi:DNA-binding GntR family transcriptional regulator
LTFVTFHSKFRSAGVELLMKNEAGGLSRGDGAASAEGSVRDENHQLVIAQETEGQSGKSAANRPLGLVAYEAIRHDILTLTLHPGKKISEALLSERYSFGKAPIRSALARLVQEGIVVNRLRGGHIVAPITLNEIRNLYHLRKLTIPEAAYLAAGRSTSQLRKAYERIVSLDFTASDNDAVLEFCFANRDWVVAIGVASENELLASWIESLEDRCLRILFLGARTLPRAEVFRSDYERIWTAIESGNGDQARRAVIEALDVTDRVVTEAVLTMPELRSMNLGNLLSPAS